VASACRAPKMRILLSSRRTSPLVFDDRGFLMIGAIN
jgi:hypothetical protein